MQTPEDPNSGAARVAAASSALLLAVASLFAFLVAVRQKVYLIEWAYLGLGLAVFQIARILWIPEEIVNPMRLYLQLILVLTSAAAFVGSVICIQRSRERQHYIDEHNIDRAIMQK